VLHKNNAATFIIVELLTVIGALALPSTADDCGAWGHMHPHLDALG
jgi:hypothetical protein